MSRDTSATRNWSTAFVQLYRWILGVGYERNVGGWERAVRYILGVLCLLGAGGIVAFSVLESTHATGVVAALLLVTGLYLVYEAQVQYCPLNHTVGRSTYRE